MKWKFGDNPFDPKIRLPGLVSLPQSKFKEIIDKRNKLRLSLASPSAPDTVYVRLITTNDASSHFIRWFTWSRYSHVEFVTSSGYLGALLNGGVLIRPFDYCKPVTELVLKCTTTPSISAKIINFATYQLFKPYNTQGIFDFATHDSAIEQRSWFCSQLVAAAFYNGGYPLFRGDKFYKLTPRDIELSIRLSELEKSDIDLIAGWKSKAGGK